MPTSKNKCLSKIFSFALTDKLEAVVLRNYDPERNFFLGTDVDVLVKLPDKNDFVELVSATARQCGWLSCEPFEKNIQIVHLKLFNPETAEIIALDVMHTVTCGTLHLYDYQDFEQNILISDSNIPYLSNERALEVILIYSLLDRSIQIKGRYQKEIKKLEIPEALLERVLCFLKIEPTENPIHYDNGICEVNKRLWLKINIKVFFRAPLLNCKNVFLKIINVIARLSKPPGYTIVFLGVDGSGKTSLISKIRKNMAEGAIKSLGYHLRPRIFPSLAKLRRYAQKESSFDLTPCNNRLISNLKVIYYFLEFWIAYIFTCRLSMASGKMVFFDRFFYDYFYDNKQKNTYPSENLLKSLTKLLPKPTLTFVLHGSPHVIVARKQELTEKQIELQQKLISENMMFFANSCVVNVDDDFETIAKNIKLHILHRMKNRTE